MVGNDINPLERNIDITDYYYTLVLIMMSIIIVVTAYLLSHYM